MLDLPNLQTIVFDGDNACAGDNQDNCKTTINDIESYNNALIMKSM